MHRLSIDHGDDGACCVLSFADDGIDLKDSYPCFIIHKGGSHFDGDPLVD